MLMIEVVSDHALRDSCNHDMDSLVHLPFYHVYILFAPVDRLPMDDIARYLLLTGLKSIRSDEAPAQ